MVELQLPPQPSERRQVPEPLWPERRPAPVKVTPSVKAGDILVLPAGTGHRLIESSRDFLVVGAYPQDGTYDERTDTRERPDAIKRIAKVRKPKTDPVLGPAGPLLKSWRSKASRS